MKTALVWITFNITIMSFAFDAARDYIYDRLNPRPPVEQPKLYIDGNTGGYIYVVN